MGQNFDDYPGFQQTPGMPIPLQHSEILSFFAILNLLYLLIKITLHRVEAFSESLKVELLLLF